METPERDQSTIRMQDYAETGSDRSAGAATRATAVIVMAVLLPWALLQRGLRSVIDGSRRPMSALFAAARQVGRALTAAVRRAGARLTAVTRWTTTALKVVLRRVIKPGSEALIAIVGWAGAAAKRLWRALVPIGRIVAAGILIMVGLLSGWVLGAARLLYKCARPLGVLLRGAWFSVRRAGSVLWTVGRALMRALVSVFRTAGMVLRRLLPPFRLAGRAAMRVLVSVFRTAGMVLRRLLAPFRLAGRALMRVLVSVFRTAGMVLRRLFAAFRLALRATLFLVQELKRVAAAVLRLVDQAAITIGRPLARVLAVTGRLAFRVAAATFKTTGRLLFKVVRPLLGAAAILSVVTYWLLTATGRRIKQVISFWLERLAGVVAAGSRGLARLRDAWRFGIRRIADACADLSRRTAGGARVAAGTARHRANRLAVSASSRDWRTAAYADGSPSVVSEDAYEASFTLDVHENEYLRPGESTISAVISISSEIHRESTDRPEMVEVILLDCSASMGYPWDKIVNARRATQAAVAGLSDGVWFAVIRGAESAEVAYPRRGGLVRASDRTRREAFKAIGALRPVGGTAIGRWLSLASELVALRPGALGHVLLLTDGKDEDESPAELRRALEGCEGAFQCDCRGVGTDWAVEELRRVSTALLGTVDIIREPTGMEADFRSVIERAMSRGIGASMRIRMPVHAKVTAFRQVSPTIVDLSSQARRIDTQTIQFGLGGWSDERREYHLSVTVEPAPIGSEMAACRLAIVVAKKVYASGLVRAIWTDDPELAAQIDPEVAHYTGQAELAAAVQEGLQAKREGDLDSATLRLGRAVQLATGGGNADLLSLLTNVVDVIDGDTGTVRLRTDVEAYDEMALDTRSTRTVPARAPATSAGMAP
jgi:von Willebrand factor type A C-terminal domain/von Willebrand factor type A domain